MSIKRILAPIPASISHHGKAQNGKIEVAASAAKILNSHLEAVFIHEQSPARSGRSLQAGGRIGGMGKSMLEIRRQEIERQEQCGREVHSLFVQACSANGVRVLEKNGGMLDPPTASWHESTGSHTRVAMSRAPAFDMIIASSALVAEPLREIAEGALLQSGRPVLLAPSRMKRALADTAMIAWDESPECWHAVTASLPFLQQSRRVTIVSIDRKNGARQASQEKVQAYLRCHNIDAKAKIIDPMSRPVGDAILATAGDEEADLIVMGAYSRGRLREMMFGGATRHILNNASATPVFLAH